MSRKPLPNLPETGRTIVYDIPPNCSWATVGELYRVAHVDPAGDVHIVSVARGCGTFDRARLVSKSAWHYVD